MLKKIGIVLNGMLKKISIFYDKKEKNSKEPLDISPRHYMSATRGFKLLEMQCNGLKAHHFFKY